MRTLRIALPTLLVLTACSKSLPVQVYQAVPVVRRDIVVTAQAAGAINPDTIVEVKSKASGEILNILVQTGEVVQRGTLMVQIDRRVPLNDSATAQATLDVTRAQLANAQSTLTRTKELFDANAVTQQELESAQLSVANANANVVRNEIALRNAIIALNDTYVRAPITGTVIKKQVERGTVISSPTNSVSGGTTLLTMADLSLVQVKTFVDETDIGKLRPGLTANVTVNAYPNQPFNGEVLKIEPQGDTIQNVTMFPVLIRIQNRNDLLKPGMNTDVKINVAERKNVLVVPNAALRTEKDVASAGRVLGITDDDLTAMMVKAKEDLAKLPSTAAAPVAMSDMQGAPLGSAGAAPAAGARPRPAGDSSASGRSGQMGGTGGQGTAGGANGGGRSGGRGGRGGRGGAGRGNDYLFGGTYVVFALRDGKPTPVFVRTGLTDMDFTEVRAGLQESDSVLMLPSASFLANQERMQQRMGRNAGLPGQTTTPATPGGGGGGGGGGRGGR